MSGDEFFVLVGAAILTIVTLVRLRTSHLHPLHFENNPGIGLIKVAVFLSLILIALVIRFFADESVVGVYAIMYLVLGYVIARNVGELIPAAYGVRLRPDIYERKNFAAADLIAG